MTSRVLGSGHTCSASATRSNDTTTYTSGDVVGDGTVMVFSRASKGVGTPGIIQQAIITSSAYVAAAPALELWLFDTTIGVDADNAVFTPTDAELATLVGIVSFAAADWKIGTATAGTGGNQVCVAGNVSIPFNTTPDVNALYGVLVVRSAYVPIALEVFGVRLQILD
jgi:hypothetical protein